MARYSKLLQMLTVVAMFFMVQAISIAQAPDGRGYLKDEVDRQAGKNSLRARRYAKGSDPGSKQLFDDYMNKYLFPMLTRPEPENLGKLSKLRTDFFKQFLWPATKPIQTELTELAFKKLVPIVKKNYHPAVRFNAMMMIGMLDAEVASGNSRPPKPHAKANKLVTGVIKSGVTNARMPTQLLVAGLIGMERHAEYNESLSRAAKQDMTNTLLALLNQKELPRELKKEVDHWIRVKAMRSLSLLKSPGEKNEVLSAWVKLMDDDSMSIDERCSVAKLLKKIELTSVPKPQLAVLGKSLVTFTNTVAQKEAELAKEFEEMIVGDVSGRRPSTGRRMRMRSGMQEKTVFEHRSLISHFTDLRTAISKLAPVMPKAEQEKLLALDTLLGQVVSDASDDEILDLRLTPVVRETARNIEEIAREWTQPKAAPAAAASEEENFDL